MYKTTTAKPDASTCLSVGERVFTTNLKAHAKPYCSYRICAVNCDQIICTFRSCTVRVIVQINPQLTRRIYRKNIRISIYNFYVYSFVKVYLVNFTVNMPTGTELY